MNSDRYKYSGTIFLVHLKSVPQIWLLPWSTPMNGNPLIPIPKLWIIISVPCVPGEPFTDLRNALTMHTPPMLDQIIVSGKPPSSNTLASGERAIKFLNILEVD